MAQRTTSTTIRAIKADDIERVVEFSLRAWAPVFESFAQVLGRKIFPLVYPDWLTTQARAVATVCGGGHVWVAQVGDRVAGFVAVEVGSAEPRSGEIDMIAVDPDFQRRGIATKLIDVAEDFLRTAGVAVAEVATGGDPGHAPARLTYQKAGFTALPLMRYYKAL